MQLRLLGTLTVLTHSSSGESQHYRTQNIHVIHMPSQLLKLTKPQGDYGVDPFSSCDIFWRLLTPLISSLYEPTLVPS